MRPPVDIQFGPTPSALSEEHRAIAHDVIRRRRAGECWKMISRRHGYSRQWLDRLARTVAGDEAGHPANDNATNVSSGHPQGGRDRGPVA